jgi:hypothetical protein
MAVLEDPNDATKLTFITLQNIMQGETYVDAGVTASDIEDGNLTAAVAAYGRASFLWPATRTTHVSNPCFVRYMASCDAASNICQALAYGVGAVDTSKPTDFPFVITYNVKDRGKPQLAALEVRRRVFVLNPCAGKAADGGDEILCEDSGKCSTNGACIELAEEVVVVMNLPPVVTLKGPATLEIAQYTGYVQCPVDQDVPVSALCDRGATAKDDKDGDLTDFVLACGETYTDNGIAGCYVDTNKVGPCRLPPGRHQVDPMLTPGLQASPQVHPMFTPC